MLLCRSVCRFPVNCGVCAYPIDYPAPLFSPTVGGVALGRYCTRKHAELTQGARMELVYV